MLDTTSEMVRRFWEVHSACRLLRRSWEVNSVDSVFLFIIASGLVLKNLCLCWRVLHICIGPFTPENYIKMCIVGIFTDNLA
jgi:hypothetical protein